MMGRVLGLKENLKANKGKSGPDVTNNRKVSVAAAEPALIVEEDQKIEVFINETDAQKSQYVVFYESSSGNQRQAFPLEDSPLMPGQCDSSPITVNRSQIEQSTTSSSNNLATGSRVEPAGYSAGTPQIGTCKTPLGIVPKYLQKRKIELQVEKEFLAHQAQRAIEEKCYPPGTVLMTNEEKQTATQALEARKKECVESLNRLPMRFDTVSLQNRRRELEREIQEIEGSITKLSRKEVYRPR